MSVDTTPPPATTATPKKATTPKPAKLTVPAKPAAVTAGNAATLVTTAAVVGGPPVWLALAGGAAATGTVIAARAYRRSTRTRRMSAGWAWPSVGRSGRSYPTGGGRALSGTGRRSHLVGRGIGGPSSRPSAAGMRTASGRGSASKPTTGGSGGRASTGKQGPMRDALNRLINGTPATRAARMAQRAARRAARIAAPVTRQAWRATKATARGVRAGGGRVWKWGRKTVRRGLGRTAPVAQPATATPAPAVRPPTGNTVTRPSGTTPTTSPTTNGGTTTMAAPKAPPAGGPLFQSARRFHGDCSAHTVKGTLEHRSEAYDFSFALGELAAGVQARVAHCGQDAVEPEYQQLLAAIGNMVQVAATSAKRLGPAFDDLHREKIKRLLNPMPGEAKWDTVNNGRP